MLRPTLGKGGTLKYIAPEREMEPYDHAVDIWSLGVIGFEPMCGHHPWRIACNPWCGGNESLRPKFDEKYEQAIDTLNRDAKTAEPSHEHIHLGNLLIQMLSHLSAPDNHHPRIGIDEALQHKAWGPLLPDALREAKRQN